jgi:hypothetical protein
MADNRKNHAGTDPETQRQEITRRGYAPHPAGEGHRGLGGTTRIDPSRAPEAQGEEETEKNPAPAPPRK